MWVHQFGSVDGTMSMSARSLGRWGEAVAVRRLEAEGYRIVKRNWRCARGEIDIVARSGDTYVFVEVKTRRGRRFGTPEESITARKISKLLQTAQYYQLAHDLEDIDWRIDLVAIEVGQGGELLRYEHVPNIVLGW